MEWYYEVKVHPGGHPYEGVGDASRKPLEETGLILVGLWSLKSPGAELKR